MLGEVLTNYATQILDLIIGLLESKEGAKALLGALDA